MPLSVRTVAQKTTEATYRVYAATKHHAEREDYSAEVGARGGRGDRIIDSRTIFYKRKSATLVGANQSNMLFLS